MTIILFSPYPSNGDCDIDNDSTGTEALPIQPVSIKWGLRLDSLGSELPHPGYSARIHQMGIATLFVHSFCINLSRYSARIHQMGIATQQQCLVYVFLLPYSARIHQMGIATKEVLRR